MADLQCESLYTLLEKHFILSGFLATGLRS
jgi:hypothetical protein